MVVGWGTRRGPPRPVIHGGGVVDPLQGGPHSEVRFQLAKWQMKLPKDESAGSPYLNEREIRQVAHFVCVSECAKGGGPKVMPIFVTIEITEDPRVDEFREKIHKKYDGLVLRTDLPPEERHP